MACISNQSILQLFISFLGKKSADLSAEGKRKEV